MGRSRRRAWLIAAFAGAVALATAVTSAATASAETEPSLGGEPADYVVVLANSADSTAFARIQAARFGGDVGFVYQHAIKGFSVRLTPAAAAALQKVPGVVSVQRDQPVRIAAQTVPTGIKRIFALNNPDLDIDGVDDRIDVDIAILDTGVDPDHPDLNVVARTDCTFGSCQNNQGDDGNGHGTHVAGSAAAIDNGIGVVGVAPGARLHAVKVLNDTGSGTFSAVVAGLDWVAARASTIEVVNLSLGCDGCADSATSTAIKNVVDKGVVVVVAAGNSDKNTSSFFPANHPDVITVSAVADFNGEPGGGAAETCRPDQDDTLADFSNWGAKVDLAAPGVCIYSTYKNGEYATLSGTSMAAPHVAGAAGYYASLHNPNSRADVLKIRDDLIAAGNTNWIDDSGDGVKEPLLDIARPPDPGAPRASFTHTCSGTTCTFDASGSSDRDGSIVSYAWSFGDGTNGTGVRPSHTYSVNHKLYSVTLTVTDNSGKTASTTNEVVVGNPPPVPNFTWTCTEPRDCVLDAGSSNDPGGSIASYAWSFGDGTTGTGQVIRHTYPAPGGIDYTVTLTVTDNQGKTASLSRTVSLPKNQLPVPVISFGPCYTIASYHYCYLNGYGTRDPDGGIHTTFDYAWDFGDGTTASSIVNNHRFPSAGAYTVKLTVTDNEGTSATTSQTVTVP